MPALRNMFQLGLLIGLGIEIPGSTTTAQTTSPTEAQSPAPGFRKLSGDDEKRAKQLDGQIDNATTPVVDQAIARTRKNCSPCARGSKGRSTSRL